MAMPYIRGLQADIWQQSSYDERVQSLKEMESYLAAQDGRDPAKLSAEDLGESTRGQFSYQGEADYIQINSNLVERDQPYQAVETLCHEDRHAYQHHLVKHPELAQDPQQLEDWQMSEAGGYLQNSDLNFSAYRFQPMEADANEAARQRTNELYEGTFADIEQYQQYKGTKEQERSDDIERAKYELGDAYQEEARQAMQAKYQAAQNMQQGQELETEQGVGVAPAGDSQEEGNSETAQPATQELQTSSQPTESQDQDYSYGYGM